MTFKQLEQFLKTEKWQAGSEDDADMCGKYARCAYCDRFSDYPCARAYDTLMRKKREGKASVSSWQYKEPDVKAKFGTDFAEEEKDTGMTRITLDPEDLFYFFLGGKSVGMYTHPFYAKEMGETETDVYPHTTYVALPAIPASDEPAEPIAEEEEEVQYDRVHDGRGMLKVRKRSGEGTRVLVLKRRVQSETV